MINIAKSLIDISMGKPEKVCQGLSESHHDFSFSQRSLVGTTRAQMPLLEL